MSGVDIAVVVSAILAIAGLGWYFRATASSQCCAERRRAAIQVTVRGGYSPNVVQVREGVPVEMGFDRQETGDCSARVVFPDLRLSWAPRTQPRPSGSLRSNQGHSYSPAEST